VVSREGRNERIRRRSDLEGAKEVNSERTPKVVPCRRRRRRRRSSSKFLRSFSFLFVPSFIRSFVHSFLPSVVPSFLRSFVATIVVEVPQCSWSVG